MNKLAALATTLLPTTALAHPGHGETIYSFAHYFTGNHLAMGIVAVVVVFALYRLGRRFSR